MTPLSQRVSSTVMGALADRNRPTHHVIFVCDIGVLS